MRACLPRSSSTVRHYAPQQPPQSTRQKRTLSDMSEEHARRATTTTPSIDLPPPLSTAPLCRPPSPVLSTPLPSARSSVSMDSDSPSSLFPEPVLAPPAPARKRRAAALAAESAIRQQLHSDSGERRAAQPRTDAAAHQELLCDEDDTTVDSCLSVVSVSSAASHPPTTAYITPEPRKRRPRRRRNKAEGDRATATVDSSVGRSSANTDEHSSLVIPTYLPPAIHSSIDDAASTPPLRRSARQLPKAHSVLHAAWTDPHTVLPQQRAVSLPILRSAHPVFHDSAIIASVLSGLPLSSFLRLRSVSASFLRASYTAATWQHQHITVCDEAGLVRLRSSTTLFALLPSLTINLVSCPALNFSTELAALLFRLPSLRCLRLLNCMKLTQPGVDAVVYCGALAELTVQNCGSLQANSIQALLQPVPRTLLHPPSPLHVPKETADDVALHTARTGVLAVYRSTAYLSALSSLWSDVRPLYDHRRLVRLDLTKYRNFRDESLLMFTDRHWHTFGQLRHLNLRGCRELSDDCMGRLANVPLHSLDLSFCVQLTNKAIKRLSEPHKPLSHSLTSLVLTSVTLLTDGACEDLAGFSSLSRLDLSQLPRLTDHGLTLLQRGPACLSLCELVVSWCERLVGDWLVGLGEGWTRDENERRMGADFLDYFDGSHGHSDEDEEGEGSGEARECDSDGDGIELADARREAAVIARRRAAQRERRRRTRERSGQQQQRDEQEMWSALRYVDVRYCHGIDVGSKVILGRLRPDIQLVWR